MEVKYQVRYLEEVINKHIPSLSTKAKALIKKAIEERLIIDLLVLENLYVTA